MQRRVFGWQGCQDACLVPGRKDARMQERLQTVGHDVKMSQAIAFYEHGLLSDILYPPRISWSERAPQTWASCDWRCEDVFLLHLRLHAPLEGDSPISLEPRARASRAVRF